MPNMPRYRGSEAGNAPSPITVNVHGKPVRRTNSVSSCEAAGPELMIPPPQYRMGRLAAAMMSTARRMRLMSPFIRGLYVLWVTLETGV